MNEGMYLGAMYAAGKIRDDMAYNQIVAAFIAQGMTSEQAVIAANNHWNATHRTGFFSDPIWDVLFLFGGGFLFLALVIMIGTWVSG